MILVYEDEKYYLEDYFEKLESAGFKYEIFDNAEGFLMRAKEIYSEIEMFIIDLMVFGPGNDFGGENTDGGLISGLVLMDQLDDLEKDVPQSARKKRIIFTNRKGKMFDKATSDSRVFKAIKKSDVVPTEFVKELQEALTQK